MNYKRKIFIVCLTTVAMCASILPLFTSAVDVFTLGETYQFTPIGDVSSGYESSGSFIGDIYFEGLNIINELNVISYDINIDVRFDVEHPDNSVYDISFVLIGSGLYPTGESQVPIYYETILVQLSQDTIGTSGIDNNFLVIVAIEVDGEAVVLDNYTTAVNKITITPEGFADENIPVNYIKLVSWFTDESVLNNPYLPFADDYIDKMSRFIDVIVAEFEELLTFDNFWSIVTIFNAISFCGAVLAIFILFFRRY